MKARSVGIFGAGALAGTVVAANWRSIVKRGVRVGLDLRASGMRSAEDLSDIVAEARAESTAGLRAPARDSVDGMAGRQKSQAD